MTPTHEAILLAMDGTERITHDLTHIQSLPRRRNVYKELRKIHTRLGKRLGEAHEWTPLPEWKTGPKP